MAHEPFEDEPAIVKPRSGARMVTLGIVGACALGAGLGVWARPQAHESSLARLAPPPAAPEEQAARRLQIVLDDEPAPVGIPLEVLPTEAKPDGHAARPAPPPAAEPVAPRRAPEGLMKVDAIVVPEPQVAKDVFVPIRPEPKPHVEAKPKVVKAVVREPAPPKKAEKALKPVPAKAEKPKRAEKLQKAEAPSRKPAQVARQERQQERQANTTAKAEAEAKVRLAKLMRAVKAAETRLKTEIRTAQRPATTKVAAAKPAAAKPVKVAAKEKPRKARPAIVKASAPAPAPRQAAAPKPPVARPHAPKPMRGEGPLRMVKNTCVSADPGEALVCASPQLSVRERQMQQAYRQAEAAGVPAAQLQRQQQRWLAARAAAAREAPWAVDQVYVARIAELNDQSRTSGDSY